MKQSWLYRSSVARVGDEAGAQALVVRLGDRPVDGAPPDLVVARRLVDDELVLGRATGVLAGPDDERAVGRDEALAVADGVLVRARRSGRLARTDAARGLATVVGAVVAIGGGLPGAGDHAWIDRPRVMRPERLAGVGFRSRMCGDATTLRNGSGKVADGVRCQRATSQPPRAVEGPGSGRPAVRSGDEWVRGRHERDHRAPGTGTSGVAADGAGLAFGAEGRRRRTRRTARSAGDSRRALSRSRVPGAIVARCTSARTHPPHRGHSSRSAGGRSGQSVAARDNQHDRRSRADVLGAHTSDAAWPAGDAWPSRTSRDRQVRLGVRLSASRRRPEVRKSTTMPRSRSAGVDGTKARTAHGRRSH